MTWMRLAVERVLTSRESDSDMIEIFDDPALGSTPQSGPTTATPTYSFPGHDTRVARYRDLLSKLSNDSLAAAAAAAVQIDLVPTPPSGVTGTNSAVALVKPDCAFVGTFADAVKLSSA